MNQDLTKSLWAAADRLRSSMYEAEYKHIVLGLIFLNYISNAFSERRTQLLAAFNNEAGDLHLAKRETVRAKLRVMVKTLLRRYKYPPDRQEEATEKVLRQAGSLSGEWAFH